MDRDSGVAYHEGIAKTSNTVLLVEKEQPVQTGFRDLTQPLLSVITIGLFGRNATTTSPPLGLLITFTTPTATQAAVPPARAAASSLALPFLS